MIAAASRFVDRSLAWVELGDVKAYVIEKRGSRWALLTRDRSRVLGTHATEADALAQERAIEAAKNAG